MIPKGPGLQAKTAEEFADLVDQAVIEVEDLKEVLVFDEGSMGGGETFIAQLERGLTDLQNQLQAGKHAFKDEDLSFMQAVNDTDGALLPFRHLLFRINATHRKGLQQEAD